MVQGKIVGEGKMKKPFSLKITFDLFVKALIYRIISLIAFFFVLLYFFGYGKKQIVVSLTISTISTVLYFAYDLIWDKIYYARLYKRTKKNWLEFKGNYFAEFLEKMKK